jgi:hypothetical protein
MGQCLEMPVRHGFDLGRYEPRDWGAGESFSNSRGVLKCHALGWSKQLPARDDERFDRGG